MSAATETMTLPQTTINTASKDQLSSSLSGFPTLQPAFVMKINIGDGNSFGPVASGATFVHVQGSSGTIKSVPGFEPKIDANVVFGADGIYFDNDNTHCRINVKGIAKAEDGSPFSFAYTGIALLNEAILKTFAQDPDIKTTPFGQSSEFLTSHFLS